MGKSPNPHSLGIDLEALVATSFDLVNRAMEGRLPDRLRAMRAEGKSMDQISQAFKADGYEVSLETVRRWCQKLGIPTHQVPALP